MFSRCRSATAPPRWMRSESADPSRATNKPFLGARAAHSYLAEVSEPDISLTESAAKRIAWIAERQSKPAILRLAVDGGGCAGFTYKFELAEQADDDIMTETDGVKLVV